MATIGIWNPRQGYMDEEFLFWDNPDLLRPDRSGLNVSGSRHRPC